MLLSVINCCSLVPGVVTDIEIINKINQLKKDKKNVLLLYVKKLNSTPGYVPLKING